MNGPRLVCLMALAACAGGDGNTPNDAAPSDTGDTALVDSEPWPDGVNPDGSTLSLVVDGALVAPGATLSWTTDPAGWGATPVAQQLVLTNLGDVAVDGLSVDSPFALHGDDGPVPPGESRVYQLSLDAVPMSAGADHTGSVTSGAVSWTVVATVPPPVPLVVAASNGQTWISDDYGVHFASGAAAFGDSRETYDLDWLDGVFLRSGRDGSEWSSPGLYEHSTDGVTWTRSDVADSFWPSACVPFAEEFVCARDRHLSWSASGTVVIHEQESDWSGTLQNDVIAMEDRLVLVGRNGQRSLSFDGRTVDEAAADDLSTGDQFLNAVVASRGLIVSAGGSDDHVVGVSTDGGVTWSDQVLGSGQYASLNSAAALDGRFYVAGGGGGLPPMYVSDDGLAWTAMPDSVVDRLLGAVNGAMYGASFDWGSQTDVLYRTTDGTGWSQVATVADGRFRAVVAAGP